MRKTCGGRGRDDGVKGDQNGVCHKDGPKENCKRKMGEKQSGEDVLWRTNELVVLMKKDFTENLKMEEHVPVPIRVHTSPKRIWRRLDSQRDLSGAW